VERICISRPVVVVPSPSSAFTIMYKILRTCLFHMKKDSNKELELELFQLTVKVPEYKMDLKQDQLLKKVLLFHKNKELDLALMRGVVHRMELSSID